MDEEKNIADETNVLVPNICFAYKIYTDGDEAGINIDDQNADHVLAIAALSLDGIVAKGNITRPLTPNGGHFLNHNSELDYNNMVQGYNNSVTALRGRDVQFFNESKSKAINANGVIVGGPERTLGIQTQQNR